jgi:aquaporin Z
MRAGEVGPYWVAQLAGALLASLAVGFLKGDAQVSPAAISTAPAFLAEFLGTFALAFVVLNVATAKGTEGNSYFGLAIGATVMVMAYAVGGVSGGAFNPAVAAGITVMGLAAPASSWIFLVADLAGGAAAALLFQQLDLGGDRPA